MEKENFIIMSKKNEYDMLIKKVDVFLVDNYLQMKCHINNPKEKYFFAFYVYRKNKKDAVYKSPYNSFNTHQIRLNEEGEYKVKVFVKDIETNRIQTMMSPSIQKSTIIDF